LIKLCVGIRTDLNKDSKQPNLNPNQKATQLMASCGFETSKLQSSTISPYLMETNPWDAFRNILCLEFVQLALMSKHRNTG